VGAISMAPTEDGAITRASLVGGEAKSYAPRGFYTARGGSSSLAYRTVHWRKLKPANYELSLAALLWALCVLLQMRLFVSYDDMIG